MAKIGGNPLFFVFIRGVNVPKTIQKVQTQMQTQSTHFVLQCKPNRKPNRKPKPTFSPKITKHPAL